MKRINAYLSISKTFLSIIFIISCLKGFASTNLQDIYLKNKSKILKSKIVFIDDYCFSVGKLKLINNDKPALEFAEKNTNYQALNNIYNIIAAKVNWPDTIAPSLRKHIIAEFEKFSDYNLTNEITTVDNTEIENQCYAVKAVKKEKLYSFSYSYKDVYTTLDKAFINKDNEFNYVIYLELCPENQITEVISFIAGNPAYKMNTKAVFMNKQAPLFPNPKLISRINDSYIKNLNTIELINLLEDAPYFPLLCWRIGNNLKRFGLKRNSQIFFTAGTKWPISRKYNHLCSENIFDTFFINKAKKHPDYIYELIEKMSSKLKSTDINFTANCKLIINSLGMIPVADSAITGECKIGSKYYSAKNPDLKLAMKYYLLSTKKTINHFNCNMIGNCLFYSDNKDLSLPFFLQAIEIKPDYKDALINAALIYDYLGKRKVSVKLAKKAEKAGKLSQWEREQITKILN